uniref:Uncharacterized protein n=1 Tax=Ditylenchus dipsaci TaxID=166011 RepID=A0A915EUF1_9BILA
MNTLLFLSLVLYYAYEACSAFISSEELSEEEANSRHSIRTQSSSRESNTQDYTTHYVVWDDYECEFYDFDIFLFVDCYMRYFGFKHHGDFVRGHKGLYSKVSRVIKMGAINALIKYFTGCDLLLTNEDDPFEWNRETKVREMKAEDPAPRCKHVHRHRQSQLTVSRNQSSYGGIEIYYEDRDENSISVKSKCINSYHITITALHKGVMELSRTGTHKFHFGLQCLLCGDNMEIYEDCEYRKVRYSNYKDFDLRFSNACEDESSEASKEFSNANESADQEKEEPEVITSEPLETTEEPTTEAAITEVTTTKIPDSTPASAPKPVNKGRVLDFGEKLIRGGQGGIQ